jgi:hypothetical protein
MSEPNCPINSPDLSGIEVISLHPDSKISDYQEAVTLANEQAEKRFEEFMLISWYDKDRDVESPPNTTECAVACQKDGYIHYAVNHEAKLKVDIDDGRFVFFFTPIAW